MLRRNSEKDMRLKRASNIIFDSSALTTIRNAVTEAYPKESFGILYGRINGREYTVTHVQIMQKVQSTSNSVTPNLRAKKRIDYLMGSDKLETLGSYHSHPKTKYPYLSKTDVKEWSLLNEEIQAVVSVNISHLKKRKWYKPDKNTLTTRVICDVPLTLRLGCYTRKPGTPLGYKKLSPQKRSKVKA